MERKVKLNGGEVVLVKPTAGVRNQAIVKAETPEGLKQSVLMIELMPHCIKSHPWGVTPIRKALDNLEIEEYDKLVDELAQMIKPKVDDVRKKSEQPSEQESQEEGGSDSN